MSATAPSYRSTVSTPVWPSAGAAQRLAPGAVVRWAAPRAHLLRIDSGCAWLTFGLGPFEQEGARAGDVFLCAGQTLRVPARSRVLMEAVRGMELRFAWQRPDAVQRQVLRRAPVCAAAAGC